MTLHRDHVAGGAVVAAALIVLAASGDLPFGTLASPGAGMLPMLVIGLMLAFGAVLIAGATASPPMAECSWGELPHAVRVVALTAVATALYERLGFIITMVGLLFALTYLVERRALVPALGFSAGVTVLAYVLFSLLLKSPLPRGIVGL